MLKFGLLYGCPIKNPKENFSQEVKKYLEKYGYIL